MLRRVLPIGCAAIAACAAPVYEEATLALVDVTVIPMRDEAVLEDHMLVVAGDRILAVEPTDRSRLPEGTQVVEGEGRYLTPGLWDMHVHVLSDPKDAVERTFPLLIANGITGVRDMGTELPILIEVREQLAADQSLIAPRLYAAGPLLDGIRKPWYGELPLILENAEQVPGELDRLLESGVDFFKVYDDLAPATFDAIARRANEVGVPFAGHVPSLVPMDEAARAGMHTIEHLNITTAKDCVEDPSGWFGRWISAKFQEGYTAYYGVVRDFWNTVDWEECEEIFTTMADQDAFFTPTLDMELNDATRLDTAAVKYMHPQSQAWCSTVLSGIEEADPALREDAFEMTLSTLRRIRDAGVVLLAGSDTPNNCIAPGFGLHWELTLLVEAGLTPYEALRAATIDAARALGREQTAGVVEPGYEADLVLFEANPLEQIAHTRRIAGVVTSGRWHDAEALDAMKLRAFVTVQRAPTAGN